MCIEIIKTKKQYKIEGIMPWSTNKELPKNIKNNLPEPAQTIFRNAFNNAIKNNQSEEIAMKIAWAAVKRSFKKINNKWVRKDK